MGFLNALKDMLQGKDAWDRATHSEEQTQFSMTVRLEVPDVFAITGTTTFGKDAIARLAERHGISRGGYFESYAQLQHEPENPYDSNAVAVYVEGERIGYVPGGFNDAVLPHNVYSRKVPLQLFTAWLPKGLRGEAWIWVGNGSPQWEWSADNRPPMSPQEKALAKHQATEQMIREAVEEGGERAESFKRGSFNGIHYRETVEPIKQLKREGRLEEALQLCYTAIQAAENDTDFPAPPPWYTEQAAIILRKLKRPDEEEAVLRRWLAHCPKDRHSDTGYIDISERLAKLLQKRKKDQSKVIEGKQKG